MRLGRMGGHLLMDGGELSGWRRVFEGLTNLDGVRQNGRPSYDGWRWVELRGWRKYLKKSPVLQQPLIPVSAFWEYFFSLVEGGFLSARRIKVFFYLSIYSVCVTKLTKCRMSKKLTKGRATKKHSISSIHLAKLTI